MGGEDGSEGRTGDGQQRKGDLFTCPGGGRTSNFLRRRSLARAGDERAREQDERGRGSVREQEERGRGNARGGGGSWRGSGRGAAAEYEIHGLDAVLPIASLPESCGIGASADSASYLDAVSSLLSLPPQ